MSISNDTYKAVAYQANRMAVTILTHFPAMIADDEITVAVTRTVKADGSWHFDMTPHIDGLPISEETQILRYSLSEVQEWQEAGMFKPFAVEGGTR